MRKLVAILFGMIMLLGLSAPGGQEFAEQKPDRRYFMRQKLTRTQEALEGIVVADYAMVAKSAQDISVLCMDESWSVIQTMEYADRTKQFQRVADQLAEMAREENYEAVTLKYGELVNQCFACHQAMRGVVPGR